MLGGVRGEAFCRFFTTCVCVFFLCLRFVDYIFLLFFHCVAKVKTVRQRYAKQIILG